MDFTLSEKAERTRAEIRKFVDTHLIPLESDRRSYD
jgi:hypothetical protein